MVRTQYNINNNKNKCKNKNFKSNPLQYKQLLIFKNPREILSNKLIFSIECLVFDMFSKIKLKDEENNGLL